MMLQLLCLRFVFFGAASLKMLQMMMLVLMVMSAAAFFIMVMMVMLMLMVMSAAAFFIMVMVMVVLVHRRSLARRSRSALLFAVTIRYRNFRFIRTRYFFNLFLQTIRLRRLHAQLLGRKHNNSFVYLWQLADIAFDLGRTVGAAEILQQIYLICHTDSSHVYFELRLNI